MIPLLPPAAGLLVLHNATTATWTWQPTDDAPSGPADEVTLERNLGSRPAAAGDQGAAGALPLPTSMALSFGAVPGCGAVLLLALLAAVLFVSGASTA